MGVEDWGIGGFFHYCIQCPIQQVKLLDVEVQISIWSSWDVCLLNIFRVVWSWIMESFYIVRVLSKVIFLNFWIKLTNLIQQLTDLIQRLRDKVLFKDLIEFC